MFTRLSPTYDTSQAQLIALVLSESYSYDMRDLFAERFKSERERAGLTQDDIAEVCINPKGDPLSRAAIAQWEKQEGGTKPTYENLVASAQKIGISIDYLVGLTSKRRADQPSNAEMAKDGMGDYYSLSDEAVQIALRWQHLPLPAKDAIKKLISVIKPEKVG